MLDAQGNVLWDRTYGGTGRDELFSMVEMPDASGFLLGCHSSSDAGGDKSENCRGNLDFWVIRIDNQGNVLWEKTIGGNGEDQLHDLLLTPDGHLLASGGTQSQRSTGEVGPDFARGAKDYWIVKLDLTTRQVLWNHRFGGPDDDFAYALCLPRSGGILLGGRSASFTAPPTVYNNGKDAPFWGGASDYWLLQLDDNGLKQREWSFGGTGLDDLYALHENAAGQLLLGGVSDSDISGNKTSPLRGKYDFWLVQLDPTGAQQWQYTVGGSDQDALTKIEQLPNGAWLLGGHSQSNTGFEKSRNSFGVNDFWIVSTQCNLGVSIQNTTTAPPCSGEPAVLEATVQECDGCQFFWNNESEGATLTVPPATSDTFTVLVSDANGCLARDTFVLDWPAPPTIDLGPPDTLIEEGTRLVIGGNNPELQYLWSNGSSSPTLTVLEAGYYAVTVTDPSGCTATDVIQVFLRKKSAVAAPNVISPNFDGLNDYFFISADRSVRRVVVLEVADRWGEILFHRENFEPWYEAEGWDGTFRGRRMEAGVYVWYTEVEFLDGKRLFLEGSVTIVR
jgi:gliding motility-associated-like protein